MINIFYSKEEQKTEIYEKGEIFYYIKIRLWYFVVKESLKNIFIHWITAYIYIYIYIYIYVVNQMIPMCEKVEVSKGMRES